MAIRLRCIFASLLLVALSASVQAQVVEDTLRIYFHVSQADYDKNYKDNDARVKDFFARFNALRSISGVKFVRIETIGSASPEGPFKLNDALSKERHDVLHRLIVEHADFADSIISSINIPQNWEALSKCVRMDSTLANKERILDIIENYQGDKIQKLRSLDNGHVYEYIAKNIFPYIRSSRICYCIDLSSFVQSPQIVIDESYELPDEDLFKDLQVDSTLNITIAQPTAESVYKIEVKTNAVGLGFGMANVAAEFDIIPHLSVNIPFYYSGGFDYFKPTIKFRGIVLQPELRYYPWLKNEQNDGFFAGAHFGLGWYNYALNGDYRIQDYNGRRPAFGGGLSVGYKTRFKKNPSWGVEFALGAGVYNAKYDIFYNVENGPYYKSGIRKTWFGIDNAAVSFFYDIDIKKKGGKR